MDKVAGIVLCGGRSSRMGVPKLSLPFGPELMLQRVVRLMSTVVDPIVVVAAPGQEVPALPEVVSVVRDRREARGPLEGLAAGLATLPASVTAAYVTSCDVPLLAPAFFHLIFELLDDSYFFVPVTDGFHHPLAAVYRRSVLEQVDRLLAADRLRVLDLFDSVRTRRVSEEELRSVDLELLSLENLNRPEDYLRALSNACFEPAPDVQSALHRTPNN
jgi:molybdopterin-guanine dinucleotide biosynthesis protein A